MNTPNTKNRYPWQKYWTDKNLKKMIIELVRKLYFAPMFAGVVRKYAKNGPLLEAGCGSGAISYILSKKYEVNAVDNSQAAVENARQRYDFPVINADIARLPFEDNSFEMVFNQGVMEHFNTKEFRMIISEFLRVAGCFVIIVPCNLSVFQIYNPFDPDQHFYSLKEMNEILNGTCGYFETRYILASFGLSLVAYGRR